MANGLNLSIQHDFLAISALLDDAWANEERAMRLFATLRDVMGKHFGQVVAMHDTESLAARLDQEIAQMKRRAGITETPENRCGGCWTFRWNDSSCWHCSASSPFADSPGKETR